MFDFTSWMKKLLLDSLKLKNPIKNDLKRFKVSRTGFNLSFGAFLEFPSD